MEHRYYPRFTVHSRIFIHSRNSKCIRGISKNISHGGLAVRTVDPVPLKKNTLVKAVLMIGGMHVILPSQVVRSTENEIALIFVEETSPHAQTLKEYLSTTGVRPEQAIRKLS